MRLLSFPGCCTANVLSGLGGTTNAEHGIFSSHTASKLKGLIIQELDLFSKDMAVLTITTNDQQKTANKVLGELGFLHSPWMSKEHHSETKLRLWYMPTDMWPSIRANLEL